jgi:hypothetical protein
MAAAIVAASLVDDNFLIGCGRLRESAAISASGGFGACAWLGNLSLFLNARLDQILVVTR